MFAALLHWLSPVESAWAQDANSAVDAVGGALPGGGGGADGLSGLASEVIDTFGPVFPILGVLMISIVGIRMIIGQDDDAIQKGKSVINAVVVGLIMFWLIDPFIAAFYGTRGEVVQNPGSGASVFSAELNGIIDYSLALVAVLAMFTIAISGVRAITTASSDEGPANLRKTLFTIIVGILLIVFRFVLTTAFGAETGSGNPQPVIAALFRIVEFLLGFMGLIALAIVIYAGLQILTAFSNEERVTNARKLLLRALLGVVVIVISFALVRFVIGAVV